MTAPGPDRRKLRDSAIRRVGRVTRLAVFGALAGAGGIASLAASSTPGRSAVHVVRRVNKPAPVETVPFSLPQATVPVPATGGASPVPAPTPTPTPTTVAAPPPVVVSAPPVVVSGGS